MSTHTTPRNKPVHTLTLPARWGGVLLATGLAAPALAHHPMDGALPSTWGQGLLAGLAHPIIGPDHLAFLLAAALWAAWTGVRGSRGALLALAFVGAGAIGTLLRRPGVELPLAEAGVALSLLALAGALLWHRRPAATLTRALALAFALASGAAHGWAFGEAVLGAEATPIGAYLLGLVLVQACVMAAAYRLGVWMLSAMPSGMARARQVTAALSGAAGLLAFSGLLTM